MIFLLLFTVSFVSAFEQYVRLKDINTEPGLPEHVTIDVVRDGRRVARLNLQENKRLNENANVYESVYDKGKQRQVKKETRPLGGFKYYHDKRSGAAVSVTCEESPTGSCKRSVEGCLNIGEETFEIRPASQSTAKRVARNIRRNLHLLTRVAHFKYSSERKRNTEQKYPKDYIETNYTIMAGKTSVRRQSKTEYAVEIIVVIDPYLWKTYLDKTEAEDGMTKEQATEYRLRKKLAHIINGVSLRYESIEDPAFNVYVTISGFQFYKTDDDKSPVPKGSDSPIFEEGRAYVGSKAYVNNLMAWQYNLSGLQHDDHIMVFTGCELYNDGNISDTSVAGMAAVGGACNYARVSIQEEEGTYFVTTAIAAHELGHNLNAYHDGDGTSIDCKADDRYIMAPSVTQLLSTENYTVNPWRFSTCSIASFRSYFQSENGKCLTDHGDYYDKKEWDKHNKKLPGELHSLDEQCKLINGDYSGVCSYGLPVTDERICRELTCTTRTACSYHTPARGSPCGKPDEKKWCIEGKCVARVNTGTSASSATTKAAPTTKLPEKPSTTAPPATTKEKPTTKLPEKPGTTAPPATTKAASTTKLPEQPDEECFATTAIKYKGHRKVTKSGKDCIPWKDSAFQDASNYPDATVAEASNYCRSPDNDTIPWCFYANSKEKWEYCDVEKCKPGTSASPVTTTAASTTKLPETPGKECFETTAIEYKGHKTVTKFGQDCTPWIDSVFQDASKYPDDTVAEASNYCRSPDNDTIPWCFFANEKWEYCDVEKCKPGTNAPPATTKAAPTTTFSEKPDEECFATTAIEYKGHIKVTKSGKECTPWIESAYQDASKYPDASVAEALNYCRAPDDDARLWCFYGNGEWEYCDVQKCKPDTLSGATAPPAMTVALLTTKLPETSGTTAPPATTKPATTTKLPAKPDEKCFATTAIEYKGHIKVTKSGNDCTPWKESAYLDASKYPDASVAEASNYCRAPDNDARPWCFYGNGEWEYCDVQKCKPEDILIDCQTTWDLTRRRVTRRLVWFTLCLVWFQEDYECFQTTSDMYSGTRSVSLTGFTCIRWDRTVFTDIGTFPDTSIADAANYCRDPDHTGKPWCFIERGFSVDWEVCGIPKCE